MHALKYTYEEVFCKSSPVTQRTLLTYVKNYHVIPYKCQKCGCDGTWQGETLSLELHHIDGDNSNNEVSNLEYLCPNCHALTDTYRRRKTNTVKFNEVSDEELLDALNTTPNIHQALIKVGFAPYGSNYQRAKQLKNDPNFKRQSLEQNSFKRKSTHSEKENYCVDCGKRINKNSIRCRECHYKYNQIPLDKMPISKQELKDKIHTTSFSEIGRQYNVTGNTVRRWRVVHFT